MNFPTKLNESFLCFLISFHSTSSTYYSFDIVSQENSETVSASASYQTFPTSVLFAELSGLDT